MGNSKKNKKNIGCRIVFDYETDNGKRGLGDVIISTPIICALFLKYHSKIDVILRKEAQPLLFNNPYIKNIYTTVEGLNPTLHLMLGYKFENYYVMRNQGERIDSMAKLFGISLEDKQPRVYYPEVEKIPNSIGIAIESASPSRSWRNDYLLELISSFPDLEWHVFGQMERKLPGNIHNHLGKLTLGELIQYVHQMEKFVTMDTLFSHLTAAFAIPTIVMYTTVPREWRCGYYPRTIGLQSPITCSPCWDRQRKDFGDFLSECDQRQKNGHSIKCVDSFTPILIEKAIKEYLL